MVSQPTHYNHINQITDLLVRKSVLMVWYIIILFPTVLASITAIFLASVTAKSESPVNRTAQRIFGVLKIIDRKYSVTHNFRLHAIKNVAHY